MADDLKSAFWDRIDDVQAGLLSAGGARPVPMAPHGDRDENAIWFITADGTDLSKAASGTADGAFSIADPKANLYATVDGQLTQVDDPAKLDELWNAVTASWFKDGRKDDDIRLIRFTPTKAEVWATTGTAGFVYELVRSRVSDDTPDMGEHGTVTFI